MIKPALGRGLGALLGSNTTVVKAPMPPAIENATSPATVAPDLQSWIREGRLSVGHAKVILGLARPEHQKLAADKILRDGLNVRQTEELVSRLQSSTEKA